MKQNSGFTYGQLEQLKELAQQNNVSSESQHDAKLPVMRSACKCTCKNSLQYENCDKLCERWQAEQADA